MNRQLVHRTCVLALALTTAAARPAAAQPADDAGPDSAAIAPTQPSAWTVQTGGFTTFDFETGIGTRDLSRQSYGGDVTLSRRFGAESRWNIDLSFGASVFQYEFDGFNGIGDIGNDFAEDFTTFSISPTISYAVDRSMAYFGSVSFNWSSEDAFDNDGADGFTIGAFGGVRYQSRPGLAYSLGFGYRERLTEDDLVIPFIGLEWEINEQTRLSIRGLEANLTRTVSDDLDAFVGLTYDTTEFRLDDVGVLPDGLLDDERLRLRLGLTWQADENLTLDAEVGATVWGSFELENRAGATVFDEDIDPAPYVGLRLRYRW